MSTEYHKTVIEGITQWRKTSDAMRHQALRMTGAARVTNMPMLEALEGSLLRFRSLQADFCGAASALPKVSPLSRSILAANIEMSAIAASLVPYRQVAEQLAVAHKSWGESVRASVDQMTKVAEVARALSNEFQVMTNRTLLCQQAIARASLKTLGVGIVFPTGLQTAMNRTIDEMMSSYGALWGSWAADTRGVFRLPVAAVKEPTREVCLAALQVEAVAESPGLVPQSESSLHELQLRRDYVRQLISSVDSRLTPLYDGACEALERKRAEHTRHVTTSLRELFTHILQKLAPDKAFFEWNRDGSNLSEGRPTRRGRLRYVCKGVNHGPFTDFVEHDVEAAVAVLQLLHQGTHAIVEPFDEQQLQALVIRMECLLCFLIEVSQSKE